MTDLLAVPNAKGVESMQNGMEILEISFIKRVRSSTKKKYEILSPLMVILMGFYFL